MPNKLIKMLQNSSLILALLLHLIFFLCLSLVSPILSEKDEKPGLYIPSYAYQEPEAKPAPPEPEVKPQPAPQPVKPVIEKQVKKRVIPVKKDEIALSKNKNEPGVTTRIAPDGRKLSVMRISKKTEPVHLIGDETVVKPLLVLLGKALTAKLKYPQVATDFGVRGVVGVGFKLDPNGTVSDARIVQSSGAGVLDTEALRAVNATSPVKNVDQFLNAPRYLVVGIIFG